MKIGMNSIKIMTAILILASGSYFLIDNKSKEVLREASLPNSDKEQKFNTHDIAADSNNSSNIEIKQAIKFDEESYPESNETIKISSNELNNTSSSKFHW